MSYDLDDNVRDALDRLEAASRVPARLRTTRLNAHVDEISEHAFQLGLSSDELNRLLRLFAVRSELDQSSITTLIKNLYPAERVGSESLVTAIGSLGHGQRKPSPATQVALVRWMIAIHDVLEDSSLLSRFYGVIFNLLDMVTIRPPLCHLLAVITRRKHVRPFRIQRLLGLCQQFGNEPALIGLLRVFKNFYPDIIVGSTLSGRSSTLSQIDLEWRKRLFAIQEAASRALPGSSMVRNGFRVARNDTKKSKGSAIPELHTFRANEASITLEDIDKVDTFVEVLEKIDPPSQLVSGLKDPLLQKYLMLNASADTAQRLEFWLQRYFEEEVELLQEGFGLSSSLTELLAGLVSYAESTKTIHPAAERFLITYLPQWDGASNLGLILDLLIYLAPQKYHGIRSTIFSPLDRAVLSGGYTPFETLFGFYGKLVQKWIDTISSRPPQNWLLLADLQDGLRHLQEHVSMLALSALAASESSGPAIISYFEKTSTATLTASARNGRSNIPISLPSPQTFYLLLMSSSISSLSRLCSVLVTYKSLLVIELRESAQPPGQLTATLNSYLMDTCNLLWRSRALVSNESNTAGCLCPPTVVSELQLYLPALDRDYSLAAMFGLSLHPLLSAVSRSAFAELEEAAVQTEDQLEERHSGPVSLRSLVVLSNDGGLDISWEDYRIQVLDWMEKRGLGGIKELMRAIVKNMTWTSPLRNVPGPLAARFTKIWFFNRVRLGRFEQENISLHKRYGPIVRVAANHYSIDDPSAVKTIYGIGSKFPKSDWYEGWKHPSPDRWTLFPDRDIKRHAETRKRFQALYSMTSLVSYETFVDDCAAIFESRLDEIAEKGVSVNMAHWLQCYAFDVIACITFGQRFGFLDRGEDIDGMIAALNRSMKYSTLIGIYPRLHPLLFDLAAKLPRSGVQGRLYVMQFVQKQIERRHAERKAREEEKGKAQARQHDDGTPQDFLDKMMNASEDDPSKVTPYHVFMMGLSNIIAGSDTTAISLSSILYHLVKNPETMRKLKDEVTKFGSAGQSSNQEITFRDSQNMPYLQAVLKEALRLHPASGLPMWRVVPEGGTEISGQYFPVGSVVGINTWCAHYNEDVFGSDVSEFRPERWIVAEKDEPKKLQKMDAYYMPFGLGSRTCLGRHISYLEMSKLIPRQVRHFDFELEHPEETLHTVNYWMVKPTRFSVRVTLARSS